MSLWEEIDFSQGGGREREDDELGFQPDGQPTVATLANAIQCWSILQVKRRQTVGDVALAFCIPPERVRLAVDWHPWIFLTGTDAPLEEQLLEHEGE